MLHHTTSWLLPAERVFQLSVGLDWGVEGHGYSTGDIIPRSCLRRDMAVHIGLIGGWDAPDWAAIRKDYKLAFPIEEQHSPTWYQGEHVSSGQERPLPPD